MNDEAARQGRPDSNSAAIHDSTEDGGKLLKFTPPRLAIVLPLEGIPYIRVHCDHEADEKRIRYWIASRPELQDIVDRVLRLAIEKAA